MAETNETPHDESEDALNQKIYDVARQIDKILHRQPIENHAAILGMVQVTSQRRMHEHQTKQQKAQQAANADAQRRAQFAPN